MYFGSTASREIIRKYEFYYPKEKPKKLKKKKSSPSNEDKKQSRIKFDVLLTSYEMINMDSTVLKTIEWECMVLLLPSPFLYASILWRMFKLLLSSD